MVKCESLRINMFRITHTGKISRFSRNKMLGTSYVTDLPEILKKNHFLFYQKHLIFQQLIRLSWKLILVMSSLYYMYHPSLNNWFIRQRAFIEHAGSLESTKDA